MAQAWQTADASASRRSHRCSSLPAEAECSGMRALGMTPAIAQKVAAGANADMGRAILALYRSAAQPVMRDLGGGLPQATAKPGLALIATDDPYCGGEALARRSAERAGAKIAVLEGAGHWWMCQQPRKGLTRSMPSWRS